MEHGFTHGEWLSYLDGTLPAAECERMRLHLDACPACRRFCGQVEAWEAAIKTEALRLTSALDRDPEEIDLLAARALVRIRANQPRGGVRMVFGHSEGVMLMRALLDPVCGAGAAKNAVRLAVEQSADWSLFVDNLGATVGEVYGVPVRTLVERVGGLVGMEMCR